MKDIYVNQIIIVTDGKSNVGENPIYEAARAKSIGIVVNTIGILNKNTMNESALIEIQSMATAGGGISETTTIEDLGYTMCAMTQKTTNMTIHDVVNKELKELMGTDIDGIDPKERSKVVKYMDDLSESINIRCCIVLDCSLSMKSKLLKAKESIKDLLTSLESRLGVTEVALIGYPNEEKDYCVFSDFTSNLKFIEEKMIKIKCSGTTPTAAALNGAINIYNKHLNNISDETHIFNNDEITQANVV